MRKNIYTKQFTDWEQMTVLIDIKTASQLLTTSEVTVRTMLRNGNIKGAKVGREWRIDRDSVRDYITGSNIVELRA